MSGNERLMVLERVAVFEFTINRTEWHRAAYYSLNAICGHRAGRG